MPRLHLGAAFAAAILFIAATPAPAQELRPHQVSPTSEVEFGECVELSLGKVAPLDALQAQVPESVSVLSLTEQGTVFPGSDELGVLITRTLSCDSIRVTRAGWSRTQTNRHIAHVGTPVDTSVLPTSPFNDDGGNGADFNNYIFGYYSDSSIYRNAMKRAGIDIVRPASIDMTDIDLGDCMVDRTVTVQPGWRANNFGFTASGVVPDAACEDPVVPFIANWWHTDGGEVAVLSNDIPGQAAIFIDPSETAVDLQAAKRSKLVDLIGDDAVRVDAFGVVGLLPATGMTDMIITPVGPIGGPLGGAEFVLQNYFAQPNSETGDTDFFPFFDPITATVDSTLEVNNYLYDIDISATAITLVWNTTPDSDLPEGAVPNDLYPPYVGALAGITQEQAAAFGIADEYWFTFDQDLSGLDFTVDTTATLVPTVRVDGNVLIVSLPGGSAIGDGFDARVIIAAA